MRTFAVKRVSILLIFLLPGIAMSGAVHESRIYEPVVISGNQLQSHFGAPIDELYLFQYNSNTASWHMMPFQIDERVYAEDPFLPGEETAWQHFYFQQDDGLLDDDDELVFMVRDMGDRAPQNSWIDDSVSLQFQRLEITADDPIVPNSQSYAYLFRSSAIPDTVPTPYQFEFDPNNQVIKSKYYQVGFSATTGFIEDIHLEPPFGTGVDIFDTQKLRLIAVLDLGIITIPIGKNGTPAANERDNFYLYDYVEYTQRPIVRLIRQIRMAVRFDQFIIHSTSFYVKTKFYPFSGTVAGGAKLDPESLKEDFHTSEDIYVQLDVLRQSWDFNEAATGMRFYNQYNQGISLDGQPDEVDLRMDVPIRSWMLTTGNQGSFMTYIEFPDTAWQDISLYYHDLRAGGQADETFIEGGDTGDAMSFGDQGILFRTSTQNSIDLRLGVTAYFLPSNLAYSDGEQIAAWTMQPVTVQADTQSLVAASSYVTPVERSKSYQLVRNYPNPFHTGTTIEVPDLSRTLTTIDIYNIRGQHIHRLFNGTLYSNTTHFQWDGRNDNGQIVPAGIYLLVAKSNSNKIVHKMTLLP